MSTPEQEKTTPEEEENSTPLTPGVGKVGINTEGELTIGIGGGLAIDTEGDLSVGGIEVGE